MEDISIILREAKPLYFARKRRRRALLSVATVLVAGLMLNVSYKLFTPKPIYDFWTEEIYMTQYGSEIENMGLPVDEYGLLMVG